MAAYDFDTSTKELATTVETEFSNVNYYEMYDWMVALPEDIRKYLNKEMFLVLDEQSIHDRSVTVIDRRPIWVDKNGRIDDYDEDPVYESVMWKRHRVPFEKAWGFWSILYVKHGDESEEFLQNTVREDE